MDTAIVTVSLKYSTGEHVRYSEGNERVQFGPYLFENEAFCKDWEGQFSGELEKLNAELALTPGFIQPHFSSHGDSGEAMPAPPPTELVNNLRLFWRRSYSNQAAR
jgi:hypothetical protein